MPHRLTPALLVALSACTRPTEEWLADLRSPARATRLLAAAALIDVDEPQMTPQLLTVDRYDDQALQELALRAVLRQPNAIAAAARACAQKSTDAPGRKMGLAVLQQPGRPAAQALLRLTADGTTIGVAVPIALLRQLDAGHRPEPTDEATRAILAFADWVRAPSPGSAGDVTAGLADALVETILGTVDARQPQRFIALDAAIAGLEEPRRTGLLQHWLRGAIRSAAAGDAADQDVLPLVQAHPREFVDVVVDLLERDDPAAAVAVRGLALCGGEALRAEASLRRRAAASTQPRTSAAARDVLRVLAQTAGGR